ncbi:MAG: 6-phosphogluconolactonase [Oscillospiraceae bacterium]|nr:6-phosphogluconolactonase [Oscillospiraceae bacterium]
MKIVVTKTAQDLGAAAAAEIAELLKKAIAEKGSARVILSTGASQFTTLEALVKYDLDWSKVEMFHLDEYVGMAETHPASFVGYLKERFVAKVPGVKANFVDATGDINEMIANLEKLLNEKPVDVGVIGIGENGHIAFNDPPADLACERAYKVVDLDERCRRQQLGEGWFPTLADVPTQAVSMTVRQILKCENIVSAVPYAVKAEAIKNTINSEVSAYVPATLLKTHPNVTVYVDADSAKDAALAEGTYELPLCECAELK